MKKKELIKALSKIEEGIADVKNILSAESSDSIKTEPNEESSVEEEPVAESDDNSFSRDELMNMKYNDLKNQNNQKKLMKSFFLYLLHSLL